jgi:hypothetical protein
MASAVQDTAAPAHHQATAHTAMCSRCMRSTGGFCHSRATASPTSGRH